MQAFVLFRDRVTYGRRCVAELRRVGLDVQIVDCGSTYEPALDWLATEPYNLWSSAGSPPVAFQAPHDLWKSQLICALVDPAEPYIVTDCDVIPTWDCPPDWPEVLRDRLLRYPDVVKVGLSLDLHLPFDLPRRQEILCHEGQYWMTQRDRDCWVAPVDTTLAMYQPLHRTPGWPNELVTFQYAPALRTNAPYSALHLPWFGRTAPDEELAYYRDHINPEMTHWTRLTSS